MAPTIAEALGLHIDNRLAEAQAAYRAILAEQPNQLTALTNLGALLLVKGDSPGAEPWLRRAVELNPGSAEALCNLGTALLGQGRAEEALDRLRQAATLKPEMTEAHIQQAAALLQLDRMAEALAACARAISLAPKRAEPYITLSSCHRKAGRMEDCVEALREALARDPANMAALSLMVFIRRYLGDWAGLEQDEERLRQAVRAGSGAIPPYNFLAQSFSPEDQFLCAKAWARNFAAIGRLPQRPAVVKPKLRLGYLSRDLHRHATTYLISELIERHDRSRYSLHAYSYGPDDGSPERDRLRRAFDKFVDIRRLSDAEAAQAIAADEVDILIELDTYNSEVRTGILHYRPAPVQTAFLGYPGTMGTSVLDYIVVDPFVVPPDQQPWFTERLAVLPDCYQPNDTKRPIAATTPARRDCGLPEQGFVFCCFNNSYKITPKMFRIWMRLLAQLPGSVLWLLAPNATTQANLRREAEALGIAGERLVFADKKDLAEHLARQRLADLFLDTLPYNAHTTASDALWVGLPVVTCVSACFSSRVAGSLLQAVGLPELVTESLEDYEALALTLARQPERLAEIRARLQANRLSTSLFDIGAFTTHLEAAYEEMWAIACAGEAPRAFAVARRAAKPARDFSACAQWLERGQAMTQQNRVEEAVAAYRQALALRPDLGPVHVLLGNLLQEIGRPGESVPCYQAALALKADDPDILNNLGVALTSLGRGGEALRTLERTIALAPAMASAWYNLGNALIDLKRSEEAIAAFRRAIALKPDYWRAHHNLSGVMREICEWRGLPEVEQVILDGVDQGRLTVPPFAYLNLLTDPAAILGCARHHVRGMVRAERFSRPAKAEGHKVRLGFVSSDFRKHATTLLLAELIERIDRTRFEVVAISLGPDDKSPERERLKGSFDLFADFRAWDDHEAAQRIAASGIDILLDLNGFTKMARTGLFAYHPAPVQVNYLGFPGTMGADFIDYIIVDPIVAPPSQQYGYAEQLVFLPDCYQPNDTKRQIAEATPSRRDCGLPAQGFVFCSFNNNYKITPAMFGVWMQILAEVPGAVLWLLVPGPVAQANLRREAMERGIDPDRLVFADPLPIDQHLARHRLADLFLDTLPVNAHTTTSDALWAGLPVLTCVGESFAGRVAASLIHNVGLPELVTYSWDDYRAAAVGLAGDPDRLAGLQARLAANRATAPLFDIDAYARHLEAAFTTMWSRHLAGEPPRSFAVERQAGEPSAVSRYTQGQELMARFNGACALTEAGRAAEAVTAFRALLQIFPGLPAAYYNLGNALQSLGRLDQAVAAYAQAIAGKPSMIEGYNNMGGALNRLDRQDEAASAFAQAIALDPGFRPAYINLSDSLMRAGRFAEAEASFRQALDRFPGAPEILRNHAHFLLLQGRLGEGWQAYEARRRLPQFRRWDDGQDKPEWHGEPLDGRTLLVHSEQGFGDVIQFCRYLPLIAARGGKVVFEVPKPLCRLIDSLSPSVRVFAATDGIPDYDLYCPLLSLPLIFATDLDSIPAALPYLTAPADQAELWRQRLAGEGLKVGLVWAGNPRHANDARRSLSLAALAPLRAVPGVRLFSLQMPSAAPAGEGIVELGGSFEDFADTAQAVAQLDLVITVDTAVAHLAGALGKPVWVMLAHWPDWRWILGRDDNPWYPGMRLFRQSVAGDWSGVVAAVATALGELADPAIHAFQLHNQAVALSQAGQPAEAERLLRQVIALVPSASDPHHNLGVVLNDQWRLAEARQAFEAALALRPDWPVAYMNLGNTLVKAGAIDAAMAAYRQAIALDPDNVFIHRDYAGALLLAGRLREGWREHEWRQKLPGYRAHVPADGQAQWMGEDIAGKRLLVVGEQGFGDTIQFCRYFRMVEQRGGTVLFGVAPQLKRLLASLESAPQFFAAGDPPPPYDLYCPLISLPLAFDTVVETIPAPSPYLAASEDRPDWLEKLSGGGLKVGLVWAGNPRHANDAQRSLGFASLRPLLDIPGVRFFSLQMPMPGRGIEELPADVVDLSPHFADFADTALAVARLDLVISVDTAVAHLAAALGKPVWLLLPIWPDWRWILGRDDSPWYPGMRLFRQRSLNDWSVVLDALRMCLSSVVHHPLVGGITGPQL